MIIVKLIGGLGNQMFQYALGRSISLRHNIDFKLDISPFETYTLHRYGLSNFQIVEKIASSKDVVGIIGNKKIRGFLEFTKKISNKNNFISPYIKEENLNFNPEIFSISHDVYLDGFWQSEKYFKDIESTIRQDFRLKKPLSQESKLIETNILKGESVSIHIRRGDYVTDSKTNKIHGTCNPDYYLSSVEDIASHVDNPQFFVFSDDPDWVSKNFKIPYPFHIISGNGPEKNYEDLMLMSLCKHHIIANSTFSWWGAWLSSNKNKRIYCPRRWFNSELSSHDIIPDNWIKY